MTEQALDQILTEDCIKRLHPNPTKCICFNWARICPAPAEIDKHHKLCPLFKVEAEMGAATQGVPR